jgi:outer membrane usher protein
MMPDGSPVPMGAEVQDRDGKNLGMAGQNGQVYARLPDASGTLFIRWDNKQTCRVNYQMPARNQASGNNFIHLNGICVQ